MIDNSIATQKVSFQKSSPSFLRPQRHQHPIMCGLNELGSLNALWDRAKQASIAYLEKKVITASNHLMAYLDSLDVHTMNGLISFAVRKGAIYYKKKSNLLFFFNYANGKFRV